MVSRDRHRVLIILIILLVSVSLRVGLAFYYGDWVPPEQDDESYSELAARVASGHGFSFDRAWYPGFVQADQPTAHWSFLYTGMLAAIYALFGVKPFLARLIGAILGGLLLPIVVYRLADRAFPNRRWLPVIAMACAAIYAYFVLFAARLMTETLFITAVLWSLERAMVVESELRSGRSPNLLLLTTFGASLGIAALLRQSIGPWVIFMFAWLLLIGIRQNNLRQTIKTVIVVSVVAAAFILPFTIRNYIVYRDFLLLNSNAGYAMYSAQHPMHGTSFQAFKAAPLPTNIEPFPQNEAQWDRALMQRGVVFILQEPGRYLMLSVSRIADYFMFWPSRTTTLVNNIGRVFSFGIFLPIMVAGLWFSRQSWRQRTLLYLFIVFYTAMHLLSWSMIRYRLPVDAVLLIFAALAITVAGKRYFDSRELKQSMPVST